VILCDRDFFLFKVTFPKVDLQKAHPLEYK
jgi:hypothetical protein